MKIQFEAGVSHDGRGVNFMLTPSREFYAEVEVPEGASDDYGYFALKAAMTQLLKEHGVEDVEWWYDEASEANLAPDAHEGTATVEYAGEE